MKKLNISLQALAPAIDWIEARTKLQRILIYTSAVAVLVGAFVYFAYLPKHKEKAILNTQYKELSAKLEKAKRNAQQLNAFRTKMKAAEAQFKIVMRALPEKREIPTLLEGISQAARDAGLEILQFKPTSETHKEFYAEVPISIRVSGGYHNVAIFFDMIASLPRIVNISSIKIVPQKDESKLTTACTAVTYKFVEATQKTQKGKKKKKKKK